MFRYQRVLIFLAVVVLLALTACGDDATYSVTYNENGATSGTVPVDPGSYASGQIVTALSNNGGLTLTGLVLAGWTTTQNGSGEVYSNQASIRMGGGNLTLFAKWAPMQTTNEGIIYLLTPLGATYTAVEALPPLTNLVVPPTVEGVPVRAINPGLCSGMSTLCRVELSANLAKLGDGTFGGCTSLTNAVLVEGLKQLGSAAFGGCSALREITIPNSVTNLGVETFAGSGIQQIVIGTGLKYLERDCLANCTQLTNVQLGAGLLGIHSSVFGGCSAMRQLTLPGSLTNLGPGTLQPMSGLQQLTLQPGFSRVFFSMCTSLPNLASVILPASLRNIEANAFTGCPNLAQLTLPSGITNIGATAFAGDSALTSLTIPAGVCGIGTYAFEGCSGLTNIRVLATTPPLAGNAPLGDFASLSANIQVPAASLSLYQNADYWKEYGVRLTAF